MPPELPDLIERGHDESEAAYERRVWLVFECDFISSQFHAGGKAIGVDHKPLVNGKHRTFWHITTADPKGTGTEELRELDEERCKRIAWPRFLIANAASFNCWRNDRRGQKSLLIATPSFDYVVVLRERRRVYFLHTAYYVDRERRREKLRSECEEYAKSRNAGS